MREIRTYGSEGGGAQANAPSLPLSGCLAWMANAGLGEKQGKGSWWRTWVTPANHFLPSTGRILLASSWLMMS